MKTVQAALATYQARCVGGGHSVLDALGMIGDVLEALAREKADKADASNRPYETQRAWAAMEAAANEANCAAETAKMERNTALRRAEAAEKERDALRANGHRAERERSGLRARIKVLENHGWRLEAERDCARDSRDARGAECSLLKQDVAALRSDYDRLATLHEQDKAELVRWRKAAKELRTSWVRGHDEHTRTEHVDGCCCLHCLIARDVTCVLDAAEKP